MHKVDEVRAAFEGAANTGAPVCVMMTPAYIPYVKPYIDSAGALKDMEGLVFEPGDVCVCMLHVKGNAGFAKRMPCTFGHIMASMVASAYMCKAFGHGQNAFVFLDDVGELTRCIHEVQKQIKESIMDWTDDAQKH